MRKRLLAAAMAALFTAWLAAQGRDVHNLEGGMYAWEAAGRPIVTDSGAPGHVA